MNVQICKTTEDIVSDIRNLYWVKHNDPYVKPNWDYDKIMLISEEVLNNCKDYLCASYESKIKGVRMVRYKFDGNKPDTLPPFGNTYVEEIWCVKLKNNLWAICKVNLYFVGEVYTYEFKYEFKKATINAVSVLFAKELSQKRCEEICKEAVLHFNEIADVMSKGIDIIR